MKKTVLAMMVCTAGLASAETETDPKPDYCHDPVVNQEWKAFVSDMPNDPIIIKLAGLREGLCQMIDRGEITHDFGNEIWNLEHQRSILERGKEELEARPDKAA